MLNLDKEKNSVYFSLIDRHNEIIQEWSEILERIHNFKIPEFRIGNFSIPYVTPFNVLKYKREISVIGNDAKKLQTKFIRWNKDSMNFYASPRYVLNQDTDLDNALTMIHHNSFLSSLIERVNSDMLLLLGDYNLRYSEIENSANYWTAITAWVLAFIGLVMSLVGLFFALK